MKKKVKFIQQSEHSECGLSCVAMILHYAGEKITLVELRDKYGVPKSGFTIQHLKDIFSNYGINNKVIRLNNETVKKIPLPAILYWENKHYVILEKIHKNKFFILDPSNGRKKIEEEEFYKYFSSVGIIFENISSDKNEGFEFEKWIGQIIKNHRKYLIKIFILTLLTQIIQLLVPIITKNLLDNMNLLRMYSMSMIGVLFCLFGGIIYLIYYIRGYIISKFQYEFDNNIMKNYIDKFVKLPYSFFVNRATGDLVFRTGINAYIRQVMTSQFIVFSIDLCFLAVYIFIMLLYSNILSYIVLLIAIIIIVITIYTTRRNEEYTNKELLFQANVQNTIVETIREIETIKAQSLENVFYKNWENWYNKNISITLEKNLFLSKYGNIISVLKLIMSLFLVVLGVKLVLNNELTIGELVAFMTIVPMLLDPLLSLTRFYTDYNLLRIYADRIREVLDYNVLANKNISDEKIIDIQLTNISYKNSVFENNIITDINLKIDKGEKIAIVGRSGSGKSTLLKIIAGVIMPTTGEIRINGKQSYEKYSDIFYSPQRAAIFNKSVKENIVFDFGNSIIDKNKLEYSMEKADINSIGEKYSDISKLILSENGDNLSGGQKQKMVLARFFYSNKSVALLDESTSALDNVSENFILNNILEENKTIMFVAHRLNTVKYFSRIIVMDNGKIVGDGSHKELLKYNKVYKELYKREEKL